jgi:hypothetical protein
VASFAWVNGQQSLEHPSTVAGASGHQSADIVNHKLTKAVIALAKDYQLSQSEAGRPPLGGSSTSLTHKPPSLA